MTGLLFWAHLWTALCGVIVGGVLQGAASSPSFRFKIGCDERERTYNFQLVALFLGSLALDLIAAPFGINTNVHTAAITLAALVGTVAAGTFAARICRRWIV